mmetsp:Transcript_23985/g.56426  ORF Transcript_23985/g.56426 Transcript_23985/m.56426 type:complete len:220 (+) Transcript_23985:369-1028(+)
MIRTGCFVRDMVGILLLLVGFRDRWWSGVGIVAGPHVGHTHARFRRLFFRRHPNWWINFHGFLHEFRLCWRNSSGKVLELIHRQAGCVVVVIVGNSGWRSVHNFQIGFSWFSVFFFHPWSNGWHWFRSRLVVLGVRLASTLEPLVIADNALTGSTVVVGLRRFRCHFGLGRSCGDNNFLGIVAAVSGLQLMPCGGQRGPHLCAILGDVGVFGWRCIWRG